MLRNLLVLSLFAAAYLWPTACSAQSSNRVPVVGVLAVTAGPSDSIVEGLRQGLRDRGYVEGQNITIAFRTAQGQPDRLANLAEELVQLKAEVIVVGNWRAVQAVQRTSSSTPIVIATSDPIADGLVANLARPGGRVTGVSTMTTDLTSKRLQLLKEAIPRLKRVAVLWYPTNPSSAFYAKVAKDLNAAAASMAIELKFVRAGTPEEFNAAFIELSRAQVQALYLIENPFFYGHRRTLAALALQARLPTIYGTKAFAQDGGLMSYGADYADQARRAAGYVDKILKGAKPGDLPIDQATRLEFVVNLKTAKVLGLTIPPSVLARADEVIQ